MEKRFHFVYKITNLINDKFYIGVHSTNEIDDGYMGSGSLLKRDILEFGKMNFEREILHYFDNRHEALNKEWELVTTDFLRNSQTYNLVIGGGKSLRTVREKAIFFNRDRVRPVSYGKKTPYARFDNETYYKFIFKYPIEIKRIGDKYHDIFAKIFNKISPNLAGIITNSYNNKFTNADTEKFINKGLKRGAFADNLVKIELDWDAEYEIQCDKDVYTVNTSQIAA